LVPYSTVQIERDKKRRLAENIGASFQIVRLANFLITISAGQKYLFKPYQYGNFCGICIVPVPEAHNKLPVGNREYNKNTTKFVFAEE
jgi:hypothetical protein